MQLGKNTLRQNKKFYQKRYFKPLVALVILLLVAAGVLFVVQSSQQRAQQSEQEAQAEQRASDGLDKSEIAKGDTPVSEQTAQQVPKKEGLSVEITKLEQANKMVTVSGKVAGATAGTCVAEFTTENDRPVIREVAAKQEGGQTVCGPISIPEANFSYLGEWKVVLKIYAEGGQATSDQKTIIIQ